MNQPPYPGPTRQAAVPACWWHPNRPTGLSCARCGRPACPDCLREAPVGFQCVDCVQASRQYDRSQQRRYRAAHRHDTGGRTVAGARLPQRPVATPVLVALNLAIFVVTAVQARNAMDVEASSWVQYGELWPKATLGANEWWRVITAGFLHAGLVHVGVNMLSLWVMGRPLELLLGRIRFLALYFVSMLGGSAAVLVFGNVDQPVVGASTALFGLLGGYLAVLLRMRANPTQAVMMIVLNLAITFAVPQISVLGHLGGLAFGMLVTAALVLAPEKARAAWQAGVVSLLALALVGLIAVRDSRVGTADCLYISTGGQAGYACTSLRSDSGTG